MDTALCAVILKYCQAQAQVFLRLSKALLGSHWLSLSGSLKLSQALSGSLRLSQALSGSLRLLLSDFDFDSEPGADTKFGLPPTTHH